MTPIVGARRWDKSRQEIYNLGVFKLLMDFAIPSRKTPAERLITHEKENLSEVKWSNGRTIDAFAVVRMGS